MWHLYIGVICAVLISATCAIMYARCAREERRKGAAGASASVGRVSRWGSPRGRLVTSTPVASAWGGGPQYQQYAQTYPNAPVGQVALGVPVNGGGVNQQPVGVVVHQATVQPQR